MSAFLLIPVHVATCLHFHVPLSDHLLPALPVSFTPLSLRTLSHFSLALPVSPDLVQVVPSRDFCHNYSNSVIQYFDFVLQGTLNSGWDIRAVTDRGNATSVAWVRIMGRDAANRLTPRTGQPHNRGLSSP